MANSCPDCGCKVYNGHCVNCHEETFIAEQNASLPEPCSMSNEFWDKVRVQEKEARERRKEYRESL
jgi:hypothetical protein